MNNCSYSYEKHKAFRLGYLELDKAKFTKLRKNDGLKTSESDLKALEIRFLENEIKDVDRVLNGELSIAEKFRRNRGTCYAEDLKPDNNGVIAPKRSYKEPVTLSESDRIELSKWKMYAKKNIEQHAAISPITHRVRAIAHNFKVEVKKAKQLSRSEMKSIGGKNFEIAFDSLNIKSKTYDEIKLEELTNAIELLSDYPDAQAKAKSMLSSVNQKS